MSTHPAAHSCDSLTLCFHCSRDTLPSVRPLSQQNVSLRSSASDAKSSSEQRHLLTTQTPSVTQKVQVPPKRSAGGLSIFAQVVIFVVIAVLIFLVIQNMEPAAKGLPKIELTAPQK